MAYTPMDIVMRNVYYHMIGRCYSEKDKSYYRYGARGITVCQEWIDSYDTFVQDMGLRPTPNHSLDRIDNDKGYSPENCRWATRKEQCLNKSNNHYVEIDGVSKTISEWIDGTTLKRSTVKQRFYVYKWPLKKALGIGG